MRLLDLYCKAGGAAVGYHRVGFEVVGVDNQPQTNFPFEFIQADALEYVAAHGNEFDVIHASPPCQKYTNMRHLGKARNNGYSDEHPDLISRTRDAIVPLKKPYVIENVYGARKLLLDPIVLCGKHFGLKVYRHRCFEVSLNISAPPHESHRDSTPSAGNGISPKGFISVAGTGGVRGMNSKEIVAYWSMAMGIDWMTRAELAEAIPPSYTEYIGRQLLEKYVTNSP